MVNGRKMVEPLFTLYQTPFKMLQRRRQQTIPLYSRHVRLVTLQRQREGTHGCDISNDNTLKVTVGLKVKTCARSLFKVFITEYMFPCAFQMVWNKLDLVMIFIRTTTQTRQYSCFSSQKDT